MKSIHRSLTATAVFALASASVMAQSTTFQNGSFSSGLTPGWTAQGDVSILGTKNVAALTTASLDFDDDFPLPAGFNNNSGTAAIDFSFVNNLAGVPVLGSLDIGGSAFEGSAIRQEFIATAGDTLTVRFDWAFLSTERDILGTNGTPLIPLNRDFGFIAINDSVVKFVDASSAPAVSQFNGVFGDLNDVAWGFTTATYTYTATSTGTVSLVLGVVDIGDYGHTSELRVDNISVSAVPEPETYAMLLAGLGLMGAVARRRRS